MSGRGRSAPIIPLRTPREMEAIERAGHVLKGIQDAGLGACVPGIRTRDVDHVVRRAIAKSGAESLFDGYAPGRSAAFRGAACISINEEVVHGVPGERVIQRGDLVTLDIGIRYEGWCADVARSIVVGGGESGDECGDPGGRRAALIRATESMLELAVGMIRSRVQWSEVGRAMEVAADASGYGLVTEYVGHGIGRSLHEPPKVPSYASGFSGSDFELSEGMVLAIEPILTVGRGPVGGSGSGMGVPGRGLVNWRMPVRVQDDGWTVVTEDGSEACHVEWMVGVGRRGGRVLAR